MKKEFNLFAQRFEDFVMVDISPGETARISIADLSEEEAIEYSKFMAEKFLERWKQKRSEVQKEDEEFYRTLNPK